VKSSSCPFDLNKFTKTKSLILMPMEIYKIFIYDHFLAISLSLTAFSLILIAAKRWQVSLYGWFPALLLNASIGVSLTIKSLQILGMSGPGAIGAFMAVIPLGFGILHIIVSTQLIRNAPNLKAIPIAVSVAGLVAAVSLAIAQYPTLEKRLKRTAVITILGENDSPLSVTAKVSEQINYNIAQEEGRLTLEMPYKHHFVQIFLERADGNTASLYLMREGIAIGKWGYRLYESEIPGSTEAVEGTLMEFQIKPQKWKPKSKK
jgi:hypothetical protein